MKTVVPLRPTVDPVTGTALPPAGIQFEVVPTHWIRSAQTGDVEIIEAAAEESSAAENQKPATRKAKQ
jgi:hypothetical protein